MNIPTGTGKLSKQEHYVFYLLFRFVTECLLVHPASYMCLSWQYPTKRQEHQPHHEVTLLIEQPPTHPITNPSSDIPQEIFPYDTFLSSKPPPYVLLITSPQQRPRGLHFLRPHGASFVHQRPPPQVRIAPSRKQETQRRQLPPLRHHPRVRQQDEAKRAVPEDRQPRPPRCSTSLRRNDHAAYPKRRRCRDVEPARLLDA